MTSTPQDIRITAWSFGRRAGSMAKAFRLLEAGQAQAVEVFDALSKNVWGVKAALADGLAGVNIEATHGASTIVWTGGTPFPEPVMRRPVAANGGTI